MLSGLEMFWNVPEWLSAIADPDLVAESLRNSPAFALSTMTLEGVQIARLRLKKKRWSGLYNLMVIDQAGIRSDVALHGTLIPPAGTRLEHAPFNREAWRGFVPEVNLEFAPQPPDEALGELDPLTDPNQSADLLQGILRRAAPTYESLRFAACRPKILRYKPGSRATVLFDLDYEASDQGRGWPTRVIAKAYRDQRGAATYEAMRALWESADLDGSRLELAEPLAFDEHLGILVQGYIPHTGNLRQLIREARRSGTDETDTELDDYVRKTGAALAALHGSGVGEGPRLDFTDEYEQLLDDLNKLVEVAPQLHGSAAPFLTSIQDLAAHYPADPPVPSHGAFRPDQVLLSDGDIGFVDFDGLCQAEPAHDVAEFLGKLRSVSLTVGKGEDDVIEAERLPALLTRSDQLGELFLSEYERYQSLSRERVAVWEALGLLTRLIDGWAKVKPARLRMNALLLERFLHAHPEVKA
jgi:hypothetical protein